MAKSDYGGLILLAGIAGIGYLLYKAGVFGSLSDFSAWGGGGGGGDSVPQQAPAITTENPQYAPYIMPRVQAPIGYSTRPATNTRTAWTGVTYGQAGQPSVQFAVNTLNQASSPFASPQTQLAASAIRAGAPPRIAAKIKAGKVF